MSLPYMRLYPQDYLQDTNHLTTEEHGAYLLLILNYWQTEKPLKDDDKRLAGICRADAKQWASIRLAVAEMFVIKDGYWKHKRIDSELRMIDKKSEAARKAGKLGGLTKYRNQQLASKRLADSSEPLATQTQTQTQTHKKNKTSTSSQQVVSDPVAGVPYEKIKNLYHELLPNNPKTRILTPARKSAIKQRHCNDMDHSLEEWASYFRMVGRSKFLTGQAQPINGSKVFIADLEWITKQGNFVKIFEGKYHGKV